MACRLLSSTGLVFGLVVVACGAPALDDSAAGGSQLATGRELAADVPADAFSVTTINRAREWVDVKMPYCGGPNGGNDVICGGTCRRSGATASPAWDPYRTDCSGFVSWSWALPPPGRSTTNLAPFKNDISTPIAVDDLLPGDALNSNSHITLFGGWSNAEHTQARLLEEYDCGEVAVDRVRAVSKVSDQQLRTPSGTYTAIRLNSRQVGTGPARPEIDGGATMDGGATITLSWPMRSSKATYSLDVQGPSGWAAPCINDVIVQQSQSVLFDGTCPSAPVGSINPKDVTAFRICSAENGDWPHALCSVATYSGGASVTFPAW